jgi:hypothetical protein
MATEGCERLLPLPCGPGKHRPVECLRATLAAIVAASSTPSQSTTNVVEPDNPDLQAVDSSPTRFASLSYSSLPRHSSKVGAVCVEAPVRFCAGGDQRWSSLPRPLTTDGSFGRTGSEGRLFRLTPWRCATWHGSSVGPTPHCTRFRRRKMVWKRGSE